MFFLNLPDLPSPANSGIEHIVVVTMENRVSTIFMGWLRMRRASKQVKYVDSALARARDPFALR